jgi:MerR family transcriptional regulator, redox-sensitive transcriptional activator SoxR
MDGMSIGELARRVGVAPSTVRYYEAQGVLPAARRVNGRRVYGAESLERVEVALYARSVGFSVREVKRLFGGNGALQARWRPLAEAKVAELAAAIERSRRIKRALEAGLECGCIRTADCRPRR